MVFEVKATHRVMQAGVAAVELHPDVFVDQMGIVFTTSDAAMEPVERDLVVPIPLGTETVFVVEDESIEAVVDLIEALAGNPASARRLEERSRLRWASGGSLLRMRPDVEWRARQNTERTVMFEVRASHRLRASSQQACDIYSGLCVTERGYMESMHSGMAMQAIGGFGEVLPAHIDAWFPVSGIARLADRVTAAAESNDWFWCAQHGEIIYSGKPVGPVGPRSRPRTTLSTPPIGAAGGDSRGVNDVLDKS